MLMLFLTVLKQVVALFVMMGVGFVASRMGKIDKTGTTQMTFLLLYVITPCVILNSMLVEKTDEILSALFTTGIWSLLILTALAFLSAPLFRRRPAPQRAVLRLGSIHGNVGFMGLPLIQMILGNQAVIYLAANLAAQNLLVWTHGVSLMSGKMSPKNAILNPAVPSFLVGLALLLTGLRPPEIVGTIIDFFAGMNTPLAMLIIGVQMSNAKIGQLFSRPELFSVSALKLLVVPILAMVVLHLFDIPYLVYCTIVIALATPAAGYISIFAQNFGGAEEDAAQLVVLTTLLSILTLPLIATAVQYLAT